MNENVSCYKYFPPYRVYSAMLTVKEYCTHPDDATHNTQCERMNTKIYHNVCDRIAHYIYNLYMECVLIRSYIYVSIKC